jgi:hypothetical protein
LVNGFDIGLHVSWILEDRHSYILDALMLIFLEGRKVMRNDYMAPQYYGMRFRESAPLNLGDISAMVCVNLNYGLHHLRDF